MGAVSYRDFVMSLVLALVLSLISSGLHHAEAIPESEEPDHLRQTGPVPQAGDVYTIENIDQLYKFQPKIYPELIETYSGENKDLRIEVGKPAEAQLPPSFIQATKDHAGEVTINSNGSIDGYKVGMPFPNKEAIGENYDRLNRAIKNNHPQTGWMIFWNFWYRARPNAATGTFTTMLMDRHGYKKYRQFRTVDAMPNHRTMNYPEEKINPNKPFDYVWHYSPIVISPASAKDVTQLTLIPDAGYKFNSTQSVYAYLPSLRRVIPLSGAGQAHCAPAGGTDYYVDDQFGFSGNPSWFNVKYVGDKKLLLPWKPDLDNTRNRPSSEFNQNYTESGIPTNVTYQIRDHYVLEMRVKSDHPNYCYPLKRLYVDKKLSYVNAMENYDQNGKPWKMLINPAAPAPWKPGGSVEDGPVYYGNAGVQPLWDVQAKHSSIATANPDGKLHSTNKYSVSDLTPSGLLKVIK